jgi:flagellar basal-body rod modification protein FlgD
MADAIGSSTYTTDRGTKIVSSSNDLDKNAFLKILTAELSNQDPDNASDSTQYVAQMAQFASLEQMNNMDSRMELQEAASLLGKTVVLNSMDQDGNPYSGLVKSIIRYTGGLSLNVEVNQNGNTSNQEYSMDDVKEIL